MAVLPIHKYFSLNGSLTLCDEFVASENEGGVYEVIRVVDGIPLFLEEHLERFYKSAEIAGKTIRYSSLQIRKILGELINANEVHVGNILISCKINLKAFFISHSYPTQDQYKLGVGCGLLRAERRNPNAKVFQTEVRVRANEMISREGFYEVLLVDAEGRITEGSRSNVFFISGNELHTPPAGQVLLGITRQKTLQCASFLGLNWKEMEIEHTQLGGFDAAFITGTSPNILPVSQIGEFSFDVNNRVLRQLMIRFGLLVEEYLSFYK